MEKQISQFYKTYERLVEIIEFVNAISGYFGTYNDTFEVFYRAIEII